MTWNPFQIFEDDNMEHRARFRELENRTNELEIVVRGLTAFLKEKEDFHYRMENGD